MGFVNLVFVQGHLLENAQLRYTADGRTVCEFLIVLEPKSEKEETLIDVSFPDPQSPLLHQELIKNTMVFVAGRLKQQKTRPELGLFHPFRIVANQVIFLGTEPK